MELGWTNAFRSGERWALGRVYQEHVGLVRRSVRAGLCRAGWLSSSNLADIVQETFAKAFSPGARQGYDATRCYAPYLLAIARNCLVDWLRRAGRELPVGQDLDQLVELPCSGDEAESEFASELAAAVTHYVSSLSAELKAVHRRRFEIGESQARAAEALGISRQNLRTLEQKLVTALRRQMRSTGLVRGPCPRQRGRRESAGAPCSTQGR